jgi:hypothetical protein
MRKTTNITLLKKLVYLYKFYLITRLADTYYRLFKATNLNYKFFFLFLPTKYATPAAPSTAKIPPSRGAPIVGRGRSDL